jgi:hypothetical protein
VAARVVLIASHFLKLVPRLHLVELVGGFVLEVLDGGWGVVSSFQLLHGDFLGPVTDTL